MHYTLTRSSYRKQEPGRETQACISEQNMVSRLLTAELVGDVQEILVQQKLGNCTYHLQRAARREERGDDEERAA